jgi:hypothetical protein
LLTGAKRSEDVENYFNYFTEIEEQFRKCREEPTLLSPLDWALIESWKDQDFPLQAVLAGIERSFAKFKPGRRRYRKVNSLAYCSQEVLRAVEEAQTVQAEGGAAGRAQAAVEAPFSNEEIVQFLRRCATAIQEASRRADASGQRVLADDLASAAATLEEMAEAKSECLAEKLEEMERKLTSLEEKLTAALTRASSVELLAQIRTEVDRALGSYRRNMSAPQIESLERQFLKKRLVEHYQIPRLSFFYM